MKDEVNRILEILEGVKDETGCIPMALVRQALKKLEQRWIPCGERLPERYGWYLCTLKDGRVNCYYWNKKRASGWITARNVSSIYTIFAVGIPEKKLIQNKRGQCIGQIGSSHGCLC